MSKTAYNITLKGYVGGADFYHIKEYWEMCEKHSTEAVNAFMDWGSYARELFMCDYYFDNGHVFRRY